MKRFLVCSLVILGVFGGYPINYQGLNDTNSIVSLFDDFDDDTLDTSFWTTIESEAGVTVEQIEGEIIVNGWGQDSNWGKNGLRTPELLAQSFEASVDFKLLYDTDYQQSVNLRVYYGNYYFGIGYDDEANVYFTYYNDETGYHRLPNTLPAWSSGTLRIIYDDETNKFQGFWDESLVGDYIDDKFSGVFILQFHQESQVAGIFFVNVSFDNFYLNTGERINWECWEESCGGIYSMKDVSMLAGDDGWAVGGGGIVHWDGDRWVAVYPQTPYLVDGLTGVDMVSASDGWAVGVHTILRWDGETWSLYPTPYTSLINAVDMVSSTDGWAVGGGGYVWHWDGTGWQIAYSDENHLELNAVEMISATEGWVVGLNTVLHWDGSTWSRFEIPDLDDVDYWHLTALSMLSASDGWAVGWPIVLHWDGTQWELVETPAVDNLSSIDMVTSTDGWAVGGNTIFGNTILRWDGTTWNFVEGSDNSEGCYYSTVKMVSADDGWVFGNCGAKHWDGNQWQVLPAKPVYNLNAVSMSSMDHGWAVGDEGLIIRWDGNGWESVLSPTEITLNSVDTLSDSLAVAVGDGGVIIEWDGVGWQLALSPTQNNLYSINLGGINDGWAVGNGGVILRWNGEQWISVPSPISETELFGVASLSAEDAWAVGGSVILHWNGAEWVEERYANYFTGLRSISFVSPIDGWVIGGRSMKGENWSKIHHWNGSEWTSYPRDFGTEILSVDMVSGTDGWAVGLDNSILHWDGQTWRIEDRERGYIRCVDAINSNHGWIVGSGGIYHRGATISKIYVPLLLR